MAPTAEYWLFAFFTCYYVNVELIKSSLIPIEAGYYSFDGDIIDVNVIARSDFMVQSGKKVPA